MKQAAIEHSEDNHKWAIIITDGDMEFAETDSGALEKLSATVDRVEFTTGEMKHDYGLVRVDIDA